VGVRDHHAVADHPSAALHPEAAGRAEHPHDAPASALHLGIARDPRVRRGHVRRRTVDLRERVEAGERLQDRAGRREPLVQLAEDRRALDRLAQLGRPGRMERHGARDPHEPQPEARHQHRPGHAVEHAEPLAQAVAQVEAEQLEPAGQDAADQQRSDQGEQRRVGRLRPLLQEHRPKPGTQKRAAREADERERPYDQALGIPPNAHQARKSDNDPVERRHRREAA
jgi:hypothetical protein